MKVKIKQLRGETGLLKVGTLIELEAKKAKIWIKNGWAELVSKPKIKKKELKAEIETKELKQTKSKSK